MQVQLIRLYQRYQDVVGTAAQTINSTVVTNIPPLLSHRRRRRRRRRVHDQKHKPRTGAHTHDSSQRNNNCCSTAYIRTSLLAGHALGKSCLLANKRNTASRSCSSWVMAWRTAHMKKTLKKGGADELRCVAAGRYASSSSAHVPYTARKTRPCVCMRCLLIPEFRFLLPQIEHCRNCRRQKSLPQRLCSSASRACAIWPGFICVAVRHAERYVVAELRL